MTKPLTGEAITETRTRLVRIAADLYVRDGLKGISMRSLARAAGISRSTPYTYFRDQDEIVECIRALGFRRLTDVCTHAIATQSDARHSLTALGLAYVLFAARQPRLYRLMFDGEFDTEASSEEMADALDEFWRVADVPLREGLLDDTFAGELEDLSAALRAMLHGLASLHLAGHFGDEEELVARFRALDGVLDSGFTARTKRLYS